MFYYWSKKVLKTLYINCGLNTEIIAGIFNCPKSAVQYWINKYELNRKN